MVIAFGSVALCAPREVTTAGRVVREGKSEIGVRVGESMRLMNRVDADGGYRVENKVTVDSYIAGRAEEAREGLQVKEEVEARAGVKPTAAVQQQMAAQDAAEQAQRLKQLKVRRTSGLF